MTTFSVNSAASGIVDLLAVRAREKQLQIVITQKKSRKSEKKELWVHSDQGRFEQVLLNLLTCAINNAEEGSKVSVGISSEERNHCTTVTQTSHHSTHTRSKAANKLDLQC